MLATNKLCFNTKYERTIKYRMKRITFSHCVNSNANIGNTKDNTYSKDAVFCS